ncbi:MAG: hypothetical protein ABUL62_19390 [Myxococcales bacterium]
MATKLDDKIKELRALEASSNPGVRNAARATIDEAKKRDAQREKMGLPPIYGKALTDREGTTTYDARDHVAAVRGSR